MESRSEAVSDASGGRVDCLDHGKVVANGPVRRQPTGVHGEDVELLPGDLGATWRPAREPGHAAADVSAVQGDPHHDPVVIERAPAVEFRSALSKARLIQPHTVSQVWGPVAPLTWSCRSGLIIAWKSGSPFAIQRAYAWATCSASGMT